MKRYWLACAVMVAVCGCGDSGGSGAGDDGNGGGINGQPAPTTTVCVANGTILCDCATGGQGQQYCDANAQPLGACQCGDTTPTGSGGMAAATGGTMAATGGTMAATGGTMDATGGTMDPPPGETPSSGCGGGAPSGGNISLTVGGTSRRYILVIPGGYDSNRAYPLVFGFHGRTSSAEGFQSGAYGGLSGPIGNAAVVVYGHADGDPTSWDSSGSSDLNYFDAVYAEVKSRLCIDEGRVFATGHSSGGYFTNYLGCKRGDVLRAIAPLAGGGPGGFGGSASCVGQVAVWLEHGDNDGTVPISSGEGSRDYWRGANGCGTGTSPTSPSPCVAYDGCNAGYPVHWCVSAGAGHEPRASLTGSGAWAFFQMF